MRVGIEERLFSPAVERTRDARRPRTRATRVALARGVSLVPTALRGTDGWRERRRCQATFSDPIDVSDLAGHNPNEAAREATRRVWEAVQKLEAGLGQG
jgi:1-acyl-sn-glycerol-3-phosphate acyltransferase